MLGLPIDSNNRAMQMSRIGYSKDFATGVINDKNVTGFIRVKNIGSVIGRLRYSDQPDADGTQVTKKLTVHQKANSSVVSYDGEWASTPDSEYVNALDCETADSTYVAGVDTLADGGSANL